MRQEDKFREGWRRGWNAALKRSAERIMTDPSYPRDRRSAAADLLKMHVGRDRIAAVIEEWVAEAKGVDGFNKAM
jgi:UDP:flavonoid glycosyltransferase YjiC (YdhE family)